MPLFKFGNGKATKLGTSALNLEKNIQTLFEENLQTILNLDFLSSEYVTTWGGRIDTVAIDKNGAPVIIEYKRTQNDNIINQALSYLLWLEDHHADFEKLCDKKNIDAEIDWSSPRVICVAENYNKFDIDTANVLPMNIELLKFTIYDNEFLFLDSESQRAKARVAISESTSIEKKMRPEFPEKTITDHLAHASEHAKELFNAFREKVTNLDENIKEEPKKKYIAYKLATNFADVWVQKDSVKIWLNLPTGKLIDPHNLARDLTKPEPVGHWGNGDYEVVLERVEELNDIFDLVRQSYEYNK